LSPGEVVMCGAVAGALGAAALTPLVYLSRLFPLQRRPIARRVSPLAPGTFLSEATHTPPDLLHISGVFVQKLATGIFGASLTLRQQRMAGTAWHLVYGALWGIPYALITASIGNPAVAFGAAYGVVVWAVGPAWLVPKMRLMLPVPAQTLAVTAMILIGHIAYGLVVAAVFRSMGG
jgi:hypothetical protein